MLKMEKTFRIRYRKLSDIIATMRDDINGRHRHTLTDLKQWSGHFQEFANAHLKQTGRMPNVIGFVDGKVTPPAPIQLIAAIGVCY